MGIVNYEENYKAAAAAKKSLMAIAYCACLAICISKSYYCYQQYDGFASVAFGVCGLVFLSFAVGSLNYARLLVKKKGYVVEDSYDGSLY